MKMCRYDCDLLSSLFFGKRARAFVVCLKALLLTVLGWAEEKTPIQGCNGQNTLHFRMYGRSFLFLKSHKLNCENKMTDICYVVQISGHVIFFYLKTSANIFFYLFWKGWCDLQFHGLIFFCTELGGGVISYVALLSEGERNKRVKHND